MALLYTDADDRAIPAADWLRLWSAAYDVGDEPEYAELISRHPAFSPADFEKLGQWKDAALPTAAGPSGRWKPNVASVAYLIWMDIARERPACPADDQVAAFLTSWSERAYVDRYAGGAVRRKKFGLSRASTLLHFLSGGRYPIFDSRVLTAVAHLTGSPVPYTVSAYQGIVRPAIDRILADSGSPDRRAVDRALFALGVALSARKPKAASASSC